MGSVDVAVDRSEGRIVALKRLLDDIAKDKRHVEAFLREARLAALLSHPNVVRAHWAGEQDGQLVFAMDYIEGESLSMVLQETGALPARIAAHVMACVCDGLHAAHELTDVGGRPLGLVHRDLSPHNVMLAYDGRVLVLDFGVAKIDAGAGLTRTGEVKGKAAYMSPEQGLGEPLDRRSDLFAVGAVLFECLAGRKMWTGATDMAVLSQLALEEPPRLESVRNDVPSELCAIVAKLVARDRQARFRDAHEAAEALHAFAGDVKSSDVAALLEEHFADRKKEKRQRLVAALEECDPLEREALRQSLLPSIPQATARARRTARLPLYAGLAMIALGLGYYVLVRSRSRVDVEPPPAHPPTVSAPLPIVSFPPVPASAPVPSSSAAPVRSTVRAPVVLKRSSSSAPASAVSSSAKPPLDVDPHPF